MLTLRIVLVLVVELVQLRVAPGLSVIPEMTEHYPLYSSQVLSKLMRMKLVLVSELSKFR